MKPYKNLLIKITEILENPEMHTATGALWLASAGTSGMSGLDGRSWASVVC